MAKRKVNKSAAIRTLYADNPKMPIRLLVHELAEDGIEVTPSQVYFVLGGARDKSKREAGEQRRAVVGRRKAGNKTGMSDAVAVLLDLKALAERAGGIQRLKELLDVLAE
jgi:hypothetical protein